MFTHGEASIDQWYVGKEHTLVVFNKLNSALYANQQPNF